MHNRCCAHLHRKRKIDGCRQSKRHSILVETQGSIGIEDELNPEPIANADRVIRPKTFPWQDRND